MMAAEEIDVIEAIVETDEMIESHVTLSAAVAQLLPNQNS
jgi:hypothetical protein